jgi:hypothetical protein
MNESKVAAYLKGFKDLITRLIVKPADFFKTMPKTGGLIEPLLYVVVTTMFGVVLGAVGSSVSHGAGLHDLSQMAIGLIIAPLTGLIYYNSVSSAMKSKEHLEEFTKELQKMPGKNDPGNFKNR